MNREHKDDTKALRSFGGVKNMVSIAWAETSEKGKGSKRAKSPLRGYSVAAICRCPSPFMIWSRKTTTEVKVQYPLRFQTSKGKRYFVDWRDIERVLELDPNGHTLPNPKHDELLLTAADSVWLWMNGIGF